MIEIYEKAKKIKMIIMDVDGVLTDGRIIYGNTVGEEYKVFDVKDGFGIRLAHLAGLLTAIITGRDSEIVINRVKDLHIMEVHQDVSDKLLIYRKLLNKYGLSDEEVTCIGDDLMELPILKKAGLSVAVADAVAEVKEIVDIVTIAKGGRGAVRELVELILKAQNKWDMVLDQYK
ncbi:MAG: HAD hydrolase family protein [bacterium]